MKTMRSAVRKTCLPGALTRPICCGECPSPLLAGRHPLHRRDSKAQSGVRQQLLRGLIVGGLFLSSFVVAAPRYPLALGPAGSRYLVDQDNVPFLWVGDSPWSLVVQPTKAEAQQYLDDRRNKGFNMLLAELIEHQFCSNPSGSRGCPNREGQFPFTGATFTTPNESYFAHADWVITQAAQRGICILLCPLYLGYDCGGEGWCDEVQAASTDALRSWGRYVGNRYRQFPNIVWCIGGDTDPSPVKSKVQAMIAGIRENDPRPLYTAHNQPESFAVSPWQGESWLTINNVYSYSTALYTMCRTAYQRSPVMPFFLIESAYENEHNASAQRLRSQAYWPVLCGGMGFIFGNCPIWHFGANAGWCGSTDWKGQLNNAGSRSMGYCGRLFRSRPWHLLVPDFGHAVLTAGYGTWGDQNYATAARCTDGSSILAYLPTKRTVTVDMTKVGGTRAKCWWFNPSNGEAALIGTYDNTGSRSFTPPSNGDWVLVVDDESKGFPAPGVEQTTAIAAHAFSPAVGRREAGRGQDVARGASEVVMFTTEGRLVRCGAGRLPHGVVIMRSARTAAARAAAVAR